MSNRLQALIVDDEELARLELRTLLNAFTGIEVAGEADSVDEAKYQIEHLNPDIIFLDIQMPGKTGFDLLEELETEATIIFVTAYDEYAIRAFEVNALDYLIKPVYPERLAHTISRLLKTETVAPDVKPLSIEDFIFAKVGKRMHFIKIKEIKAIEAAREYTEIHVNKSESVLILKSMHEWESRLPESHFLRIHRSCIINLDNIDRVEEALSNAYHVYIKGIEKSFPMSQRYFTRIKKKLN